ncbi:hypothetical protein GCM10010151_07960 [Actinoallomurus spadix]|uniref:Uncharacterized protein n=1 Tax=Actinoallomurus spadix TaxID=79912 RepID=A0ABN0VYR0_9ACTN
MGVELRELKPWHVAFPSSPFTDLYEHAEVVVRLVTSRLEEIPYLVNRKYVEPGKKMDVIGVVVPSAKNDWGP